MAADSAVDLRSAADVLERDGWTQGTYFAGTACCQAGALIRVLDPEAESTSGLSRVSLLRWIRAQEILEGIVTNSPIAWNDEPGRTADEVIATLRTAADKAEQA